MVQLVETRDTRQTVAVHTWNFGSGKDASKPVTASASEGCFRRLMWLCEGAWYYEKWVVVLSSDQRWDVVNNWCA